MRDINANPGFLPHTGCLPEKEERSMGKYFLAWILGVPASVLLVIYLIFR